MGFLVLIVIGFIVVSRMVLKYSFFVFCYSFVGFLRFLEFGR